MEAHVYQCPSCASALVYDAGKGSMVCPSCENEYPVETLEQLAETDAVQDTREEELVWEKSDAGVQADNLRAYSCPTCGSQMVVSDTEAAAQCPYCGNPSVLPGVLTGEFKPESIIPFKKTKEDARQAFQQFCKGKKLLPKGFASREHIEKITGVYVPFWLFDCETDSDVVYNATKVNVSRRGDYEITRTHHYRVRRGGEIHFSNVPVNSSTKLDDTLMEAVEPFDMQDAKEFASGYLSGSQAERYDVDDESSMHRANQRIRQSVQDVCRQAAGMGYATLTPISTHIDMKHARAKNVMMPVWLLNTIYKGKTYTFAMNGQTGRMVGNLPVDGKKAFFWSAGLFGGITAAGYILSLLLHAAGVM